jgi:hypothetical protein
LTNILPEEPDSLLHRLFESYQNDWNRYVVSNMYLILAKRWRGWFQQKR